MVDECGSGSVLDRSFANSGSESKLMGEKRSRTELGEKPEPGRKRAKMRHLESVFRSEGIDTHYPKPPKDKEANDSIHSGEKEMSQITEEHVTVNLDAARAEGTRRDTLPLFVDPAPRSLDLNTKVCITKNSSSACAEDTNKLSLVGKQGMEHDINFVTLRGTDLDLNAEDVSNLANPDPFYPYKNHDHLKSRDVSECGSSTGPLEEKDSLRLWKEMKQNGFLSSSHGGIPMPKQRGRKSKNDVLKKKMELAKREQVDRFTKIAAPSGLLNELNPGIINHVRNSKQVHSIIEALVRSEKLENSHVGSKQASQLKSGTKESSDRTKDPENMNGRRLCHEDGPLNTLSGSRQTRGYPISLIKSISLSLEDKGGDGDSNMVERRVCAKTSCASHTTLDSEDDMLALKLSSSTTMVSENTSSVSNEESANLTSVSSLSVKAATVASQWLELLHQDTKGRLAALRRSKKRVRAVIHTELPFLMSKEFSSNQENEPSVTKSAAAECSNSTTADMHRTRWSALFDQMDKALSEEEKQLESWLNQVKEMQLHCERGLQHVHLNAAQGLQQLGTFENDSRSEKADHSETELAVRAAAASIYSTCNFLLSMENVSCF